MRVVQIFVLLAVAIGSLYGGKRYFHTYRNYALAQAAAIAEQNRACLFDGLYSANGVPVAHLVPRGTPWFKPWADFADQFLTADAAKPFHFGFVVLRPTVSEAQVWGWSYRRHAFWLVETNVFDLAYAGDPVADCMGTTNAVEIQ